MAYPQQRMPPPRGPPSGPGYRSQGPVGYTQGPPGNAFDSYGGSGPDYGGAPGNPRSAPPRSRPPPTRAPSGGSGPGPGGPPPAGYPSSRSRGGYSQRGLPPGRGPPPDRGAPPPNRGAPMARPPPQRKSPRNDPYAYPANGAPPPQRRGSDEHGLARQMGDMTLASPPPTRPHTSNSGRTPRGPPSDDPYYPGSGQSNGNYGFPQPQRSYTTSNAPPPIRIPQRSATTPNSGSQYTPPLRSPKYPGQSTYPDPAEYTEPAAFSMNNSLAPDMARGDDLKYKTFSTYVHHNVFADYFKDQDDIEEEVEEKKEDEDDELDMPNFDAMPSSEPVHRRNASLENHLASEKQSGAYAPYKPSVPREQPNQLANAGFQFDLPGDPAANGMNHGYENVSYPGSERTVSMGSHGSHGNPFPYRQNQYEANEASPVASIEPVNPDALPAHPSPYRPGQHVSPGERPAPVRQYGASPQQNSSPQPAPSTAPLAGPPVRPGSPPITQTELERLQLIVRRSPEDYKTAMKLAKKYVEASTVLVGDEGRVDAKTRSRNKDRYISDAYKLVKKLVHDGFPEALFFMADAYGHGGLGLQVDAKEAFSLYQSAAKAGHAEAAYRTAVCCELGQEEGGGTRRDALKAVQWYRRAATLGNTPAMYKMGVILLKGLLGQQKNPREAVTWLKRAADGADAENPHALHELALLYESASNSDFIIRDEAYSRELFTQAAELGYKFSQYRLGAAYENGLMGLPVDARMSIVWYTRAAAQGEHQSELALSGWYLTGAEGILQQSDTEAYLWARKAAAAGLAKAEYAMGYFTEVGIGVPSNLEDAQRWYWRAASQNFNKARERLEELKKGSGRMQKTRVSRSAVAQQQQAGGQGGGDCIVM